MNTHTDYFYLLYAENSDAGDPTSLSQVMHFPTFDAAKQAMNFLFEQHKKILPLPTVTDDEHYADIKDDSIVIHDGYDSYYWRIGPIVLVDGGFGQ